MSRILIIFGILALCAILNIIFPYALQDEESRYRALYLILLLTVFAAQARPAAWKNSPVMLRNAAIWLCILMVILLGYSYRNELKNNRILAELLPQQAQITSNGSVEIRESDGGHFMVRALVNDEPVLFMVDTGASDIVLSPSDARRVGLFPETLDYNRSYNTANGYGKGASVTLKQLEIGNIKLSQMPASVNKAEMRQSLLGMSFLRQLKSFRFEGNTLILNP